MKIKCIFIISNLNIGGPQKSLLALLDLIDYSIFDVYIYSTKPGGTLKKYFNENINFIENKELIEAINMPSNKPLWTLMTLLKKFEISILFNVFISYLKFFFLKKNMNQERQKIWKKFNHKLPHFEGKYDLAFGILGQSSYIINDLVESKKKYHWIRSDTRILKRNEEIDAEYYKQLTGSLSVSEECRTIFNDIYPFMKNKTKTFYNYIPVNFYNQLPKETFKLDDDKISLITVTRLDPLKGIDMAVEAAKILSDKGYQFNWYILGDGKYKEKVLQMIKDNGVEKHFKLLGFQLNTLYYLNQADIFVHPSRTEGKSNAIDEAIYLEKPIVVTNFDTVDEQITHEYNGLISDMNGKSLSENIEQLFKNDELKKSIAAGNSEVNQNQINPNEFFKNLLRD